MKIPISRCFLIFAAFATIAVAPAPPSTLAQTGSTFTVSAHFLPGTESLLVQGEAPAGSAVLLRLTATFDRDIPAVVVDRTVTVADQSNRFTALLPYSSASENIAVLSVQASIDGAPPALACCFHVQGPRTSQSPPPSR